MKQKMKACASLLILLCLACSQPGSTEDKDQEQMPIEAVDQVVGVEEIADENQSATENVSSIQEESERVESGPLVYVTHEGDKYHTADCRYSKTAQVIKLSQAKADGKTACGICKPNSTTGEKQLRCSSNTSEGKRCLRMTTDASGKCFQHREG